MLKRLLTAVLVLGLILAFNSTAFSDNKGRIERESRERDVARQHVDRLDPKFRVNVSKENPLSSTGISTPAIPAPQSPDTTMFGVQGYYADPATSFITIHPRRPNHPSTVIFAMRMDETVLTNRTTRVLGAYHIIFRAKEGGVQDGKTQVRVSVYDDLGGLPGPLLHTQVYAVDTTGATNNSSVFTYFPFSTPVALGNGGAYHLAIGPDTLSVVTTDTTYFTSDDAGTSGTALSTVTSRGTIYTRAAPGPGWFPFSTLIAGNRNFSTFADEEYIYSLCRFEFTPAVGAGFIGDLQDIPSSYWADGSTLTGMSQKFTSLAPDTIKQIRFRHYANPGVFGFYYDGTSTNTMNVMIFPDDGFGNADASGGPLATVNLGPAQLFPTGFAAVGYRTIFVDFSSFNLEVLGPWHAAFQMTSPLPTDGAVLMAMLLESDTTPAFYTDGSGAGVCYTSPGTCWQSTATNTTWLTDPAGWGSEYGLNVRATLCVSEFADCQVQQTHDNLGFGCVDFFTLRPNGLFAVAQKIEGKPVNQVRKIWFAADRKVVGGAAPDVQLEIRGVSGGLPTGLQWSTIIPGGSVNFGGWTMYEIPGGVQILGDFTIGYRQSFPGGPLVDTLRPLTEWACDAHPHVRVNGGAKCEVPVFGPGWFDLLADVGFDDNWLMEVEFCSEIVPERLCTPGNDWPTAFGNYQRDGRSGNSYSDAQCDLSYVWRYEDPIEAANYTPPIIWNGQVIQAFETKYVGLDLTTGAVLWTLSGGNEFSVANVRAPATVATIDVAGTPTPVMFLGGGNLAQTSAWDMTSGLPVMLWSSHAGNLYNGLGFVGATRYCAFTVLNIAGDDVLYYGTELGRISAVYAETGMPYAGWTTNPVNLGASTIRSGATNGSLLYFGTVPTVGNGDVYAVNAATGAIVWQLSSTAGYKGATVWVDEAGSGEWFNSPAVGPEDTTLFVLSDCTGNNGTAGQEGVFYRLNLLTGAFKSAVAGPGMVVEAYTGGISVDQNLIHVLGRVRWAPYQVPGDYMVYNRKFGTNEYGIQNTGGYHTWMSCEPDVPDWLFLSGTQGVFRVYNAEDGEELFQRRVDYGASAFTRLVGSASAPDWVAVTARFGAVFGLMKGGADRPRLELQYYSDQQAVPFGSPASTLVTFANIATNTGCAPLTFSVLCEDASNGMFAVTLGSTREGGIEAATRAAEIADRMTGKFDKVVSTMVGSPVIEEATSREVSATRSSNRAALATPVFLNSGLYGPFVLNPGDTFDLTVDAIGPLVNRGPNIFYARFQSNDPDYFLNNPAYNPNDPEVTLTLVGGCLLDTTYLHFGAGSVNTQIVMNAGRVAEDDFTPHGFEIDGDDATVFNGSYVYGVSRDRIAMNCSDWSASGDQNDAWISMQPDPNFCNALCKPALSSSVALPVSISSTGTLYTPLTANVVCKTYIDSVQNFDPGTGWDWDLLQTAPFDNALTMGLTMSSKTYGIISAPAPFTILNNMTLEVMTFKHRAGLALPAWKFGADIDYDVGNDSIRRDASISTAWTTSKGFGATGGTGDVWGSIKLPFGGCGIAPLKNVRALNSGQGQFTTTCRGNCYWDSAYFYMNLPAGVTSQNLTGAPDQQAHMTYAEKDFAAGNDSLKIGVAHFAMLGIANPGASSNLAPLAILLNKMVGFGRGDVNNDGTINLADIIYLAENVNGGGPGAIPFEHCGDVDGNGSVGGSDITYLVNYYFNNGNCPAGAWTL